MRFIFFEGLFAAVALGLVASLVTNARQFFQRKELEGVIQQLQSRLIGPGSKVNDGIANCLRNFDSALLSYRGRLGDQRALDAAALRTLGEDLPVLSQICGYAEASGWPHAMAVLAGIRPRLILASFVLSHSKAVPPSVCEGLDPLLERMRSFSGLQGMYYDFYEGHLMAVKPSREQEREWPDRQAAEMVGADTEAEAKQLLAVLRAEATT